MALRSCPIMMGGGRRLARLASALVLGLGLAAPAMAATEFAAWLDGLRSEARARGVSDRTLDEALAGVEPIPRVIELDQRQPEGRMSFVEYKGKVISEARISQGRRLLAEHGPMLRQVEARYGVPAEIIVALWGIESSYGEFKGRFPVVASLATLAHDGRRADFFRGELLSALQILEAGDIEPDAMFGSWAGAMGQSQFMPSTYLGYAVDGNGDGRRDIWGTHADIFASMANYLSKMGWNPEYIWGREVKAGSGVASAGLDEERPLATWQARGVRKLDGSALPAVAIDASLLKMDDGSGPSYLVYDNFRVLMRWNRSTYFATSVGLLADAIRA
ncbi:MAG: lytic murein transglycosylase [Geminicoccaceae bacterium]|nr:lytic murein transglycosylase [Geminicoccaceae bacterium]